MTENNKQNNKNQKDKEPNKHVGELVNKLGEALVNQEPPKWMLATRTGGIHKSREYWLLNEVKDRLENYYVKKYGLWRTCTRPKLIKGIAKTIGIAFLCWTAYLVGTSVGNEQLDLTHTEEIQQITQEYHNEMDSLLSVGLNSSSKDLELYRTEGTQRIMEIKKFLRKNDPEYDKLEEKIKIYNQKLSPVRLY